MEEFQIVGYDDECVLCHQDEVGSFWSKLKKGVKSVGKAVGKVGKAVVKSPLVKGLATGAAFVFPPVGVPALAAVATANGLIAATKDVKKAAQAVGVIKRTQALARTGNPDAQRAVKLLATAARARITPRPPVKATPRPVARPAPRPAARPVARPAPRPAPRPVSTALAVRKPQPAATPTVAAARGWFIATEGPNRGRIDFSGARWRRA
jgi:type II secretory pathway pseudopilin PulG